jgi:hypothetical protein
MPGTKPTKAQRKIRVDKALSLLVGGASRGQICRYVTEKWGVTSRTADRYIRSAYELLGAASVLDRDIEIGRSKLRLEMLFQGAVKRKDYRLALAIEKARVRLLGLEMAIKVSVETEHSGQIEMVPAKLNTMTLSELMAEEKRLRERLEDFTPTTN